MTPTTTEPLGARAARDTARYYELKRLLLRGEFMTNAEMKEFAALWRACGWTFTIIAVTPPNVWRLEMSAPELQAK